MIYAIAAYSITVGTLALYGVLMQHRALVYTDLLASLTRTPSSASGANFNLGAALLAPLWLCKHGMRAPGGVLFLFYLAAAPLLEGEMWIPLLFVAIVPLAAGAALGFVGNRIAMNHRSAETPAEFSSSQLPWSLASVCLFAVVFPWLWYFGAYAESGGLGG